ncbi:MAG: hypothetical protein V1782_13350 [Pseudomonadota bacterium]
MNAYSFIFWSIIEGEGAGVKAKKCSSGAGAIQQLRICVSSEAALLTQMATLFYYNV